MSTFLQTLHALAGLIVLAEALNKLERCAPFVPGLSWQKRCTEGLKALSWFPLALGAGGAIAGPLLYFGGISVQEIHHLLRLEHPTLAEVSVMVGFAVLIIRTRVKEG